MGANGGSRAGLQNMICLQAHGLQTMIYLQVDQQGLQGLQKNDMLASTWLEKFVQSVATWLLKNKYYFT
jgi:hypothetical protein